VGSNPTPGANVEYATLSTNPQSPSTFVELGFWMKKQAYRPTTIVSAIKNLKILSKRTDLSNPESVRGTVALASWSDGFKRNLAGAYSLFARWRGFEFEKPSYEPYEKLPFIPLESELDALVAGCGPKTSTVLQLMKETGARIGEIWTITWQDLDLERGALRICPEKGSRPREFKLSPQLISRVLRLPRTDARILGFVQVDSIRREYERQRKRLADKLGNSRIQQIKLHTFRHWKATMEYHRTKDILHVMRLLGHRSIKNTLRYTQLVDWKSDDWTCKAAKSLEEASGLIEAGFEYVTEMDGVKLFRKRK